MQTTNTALFSNIRIALAHKESLRAMATVKVMDAIFLTGLKIIDGKRGLFVSMPSKKETDGEYKDIFFPASKGMRDQLQECVLAAYHEMVAKAASTQNQMVAVAA